MRNPLRTKNASTPRYPDANIDRFRRIVWNSSTMTIATARMPSSAGWYPSTPAVAPARVERSSSTEAAAATVAAPRPSGVVANAMTDAAGSALTAHVRS